MSVPVVAGGEGWATPPMGLGPRPLTYEDGYREGQRSVRQGRVEAAILKSHAVSEPPSRVSFLLEALVYAVMESRQP